MRTSQAGIKLIKEFESLHDGDLKQIGLQPKMDPVGIWTEGYGRAMRKPNGQFARGLVDKKWAMENITIKTEKEAQEALAQDVKPREHIVAQKIKISLNQNQFDALVSYVYNTGGSDTLFKLINQKAPEEQIRKWFTTKYITSKGVKLPGLVRRREAEANLFFK